MIIEIDDVIIATYPSILDIPLRNILYLQLISKCSGTVLKIYQNKSKKEEKVDEHQN